MTKKETSPQFYATWPTAWGPMGAVASDNGIVRLVLPHYQPDELKQLLTWEHPGCQLNEAPFAALIPLTRDYFNAKPVDFSPILCDLPAGFAGLVLTACRGVAYGQTIGYLGLAKRIDRDDAARAVGTALGRNQIPLVVPCHRVTYSNGRVGAFSAPGGTALKQRMLDLEKRNSGQ
jgi:methylated-DNA-[protein]-cysteine S-methyltransferase